jgi:acyl-[acyl carrier protein]--UDP-N-acetylglucosamine O-acyltransferase
MGNQLVRPIRASELASVLGLALRGTDHLFDRILPLGLATGGALTFSKRDFSEPRTDTAVVIAPPGALTSEGAILETNQPRLDFAKALNWLKSNPGFVVSKMPPEIHPEAKISASAVIGKGVKIGKGTVVNHFVVIGDGVQIGEDCTIKSGAVIGEDGFGFERDCDGTPIRLVHLGTVLIGNRAEIGSLTTVCRGTLADTIIDDDVKIDDHVHIAHNCRIRRGAMVVGCAEVSGGVELGECCWVGPNATIIQQLKVGARAFVGIGANVMKSIGPDDKVAGYPARSVVIKGG